MTNYMFVLTGLYARTVALKKKNHRLKVLLAVGGWFVGSEPFVPMISNVLNRKAWVANVVKFLRLHGFDGLDMDWEFPGVRGSPPEDKYRFTTLMRVSEQIFLIGHALFSTFVYTTAKYDKFCVYTVNNAEAKLIL